MRRREFPRLVLLTLTLVLPLLLVALTVSRPAYAGLASPAEGGGLDGKAIFLAQKCDTCHSVSSAAIEAKVKSEKMRGPDLTGLVAKLDRPVVVAFVTGNGEIDGKKHKKPFKGSDEELKAVLDWLAAQKAK